VKDYGTTFRTKSRANWGSKPKLSIEELNALREKPLSSATAEIVEMVAREYAPDETDWLKIKKQLIVMLPSSERALFSTRCQKTMKHYPFNKFEQSIRTLWQRLTGNVLLMPDDKKMPSLGDDAYL
jgi:hypothetical protein